MPELPEVETVARGLRTLIVGRTIVEAKLLGAKLKLQNPRKFAWVVRGKVVTDVTRRGKHLFVQLNDNWTLWCHLRMTGRFVERSVNDALDKHDHARFVFCGDDEAPDIALVFRDVRKFGHLRLVRTDEIQSLPEIAALGPEPLTISKQDFVELFAGRKRIIKPALLDQHILAGLGNIYADEALFAAGIHPQTRCCDTTTEQLLVLRKVIIKILKQAISRMGTTFDSYSGVNGEPGKFQTYLQVYGREGEPCYKCGSPIIREVIAQRSAHYCERCQQL